MLDVYKRQGIRYSPFPPYEVLETNEISVGELQTARRLSQMCIRDSF